MRDGANEKDFLGCGKIARFPGDFCPDPSSQRSMQSFSFITISLSTMSSPVPSTGSSTGGGNNANDWRSSFPQSARNKQVREIAQVLASLEPGKSVGSKLRLAMQFEDTMFKAASSLDDYHKKLTKRLKKLQKNYKPTQAPDANAKERTIDELRSQHGEAIRYVVQHSAKALKEMRAKHGDEKARQLEQHLDAAKLWAHDLGIPTVLTAGGASSTIQPNYAISDEQLARLKQNIERRLDNVRAHVVKLADPDQFFVETLKKAEVDAQKSTQKNPGHKVFREKYEQYFKTELHPEQMMKSALEQLQAQSTNTLATGTTNLSTGPVTPLEKKTALVQLDKMRSAASALLAFFALEDKSSVPSGTLQKLHTMVTEGSETVVEIIQKLRRNSPQPGMTLSDAWTKHLDIGRVIPQPTQEPQQDESSPVEAESQTKRLKTHAHPRICLRSRILLTPGRKPPPILLPEFRRKGAQLVRPKPNGQGSHLILEFGSLDKPTVFTMTIYLVPLLVEIRAVPSHDGTEEKKKGESSSSKSLVTDSVTPSWKPLHTGLVTPPPAENQPKNTNKNANMGQQQHLSVWNVTGDYETLGFVVEQRLRDASAHATHVLRQCWAHNVYSKEGCTGFELEILEGQALRDFLQLARTTYDPNWKDVVL